MNLRFVTSFNEDGRKLYGDKFLKSWRKYAEFPIEVFLEEEIDEKIIGCHIRYNYLPIRFINMHDAVHLHLIQKAYKEGNHNVVTRLLGDYRFQGAKFARKIYAISEALYNLYGVEWIIWIDADVEVISMVGDEFYELLCTLRDHDCVYLGRRNWHHSECGFVAYNLKEGRLGLDIIEELVRKYDSFEYLDYDETHDSYVFDRVREGFEEAGALFYDLAHYVDPKPITDINVWPYTVLGKYFKHNKGALKYKND